MKYFILFLFLTLGLNAQVSPDTKCKPTCKVECKDKSECKVDGNLLCTCGGKMLKCDGKKFCDKCSKVEQTRSKSWIEIPPVKDWEWYEWAIGIATVLGYLLLVRWAITGK